MRRFAVVAVLCVAAPAWAAAPAWVAKSDAHAKIVLDVFAKLAPEQAGELGVEGLDEQITDLGPGAFDRQQAALREAEAALAPRLAAETDPLVKQDLQILQKAVRDTIEGNELANRYQVPYTDVPQTVFAGLRTLLDDQVAPARRAKALVRLRKYVGLEPGTTAFAVLARDRLREAMVPGRQLPFKGQIEKNLSNSARFVDGIAELFATYKISGSEEGVKLLRRQVADYDAFLKSDVLPKAGSDFRLPPQIYAFNLRQNGVEMPPLELAQRARVAFMEIRNEMMALAPLVAKEKGFAGSDYRDVIRALKKEQWTGATILPHYEQRMKEMEDIIRRQHIISLPARAARIRLASEAESAALPAPNMHAPRMIGNTGEIGEFVLPLRVPTAPGGTTQALAAFDDFTYDAAAWTLVAHEGRPGHELQFASVVEKGVSIARAIFGGSTVNVEGWALYAEAEMKPYEPLDGQLITLQLRLLRACRAFLDPELQMGKVQPEEAVRFLMDEAVFSEPMARQEVERYTFQAPSQAPSYFYGYTRWLQLRSQAEFALGKKFDRQRFHDFLLGQGFLPPDTLTDAVMNEFVPAEKARAN